MCRELPLYLITLLHLKPQQIYRRIWFHCHTPDVDIFPHPSLTSISGRWCSPAKRKASMLGESEFLLLNEPGQLLEIGWDGAQRSRLWRYNQHYFDDLNAKRSSDRYEWHLSILDRWVRENPPANGVGWEPYPTSLRIVNWIKWQMAGNLLTEACLQSLAVQIRWLNKRLEWHILGNHLFANAKALVFAGLIFQGEEANEWLTTGLKIISKELPEQVLYDGGNFERSPMYHAIFLEDILDLINISNVFPEKVDTAVVERWKEVSAKMLDWLRGISHPDGEISFFNDAAFGIAPTPNEIYSYAARLGIKGSLQGNTLSAHGVTHFADSGYVRLTKKDVVALLDVAKIGPDYLPGHAHADTLSFELSVFGQRIIVNGGTSQYGSGPIRLQERGTAAHSTVEIDHQDSSEVWSGFRVARRAYPANLRISEEDDIISVACAHNGYKRLPGKPIHYREWKMSGRELLVHDRIEGTCDVAVAHYHFHPDVQIAFESKSIWKLFFPDSKKTVCIRVIEGNASLNKSYYAPEFGKRLETHSLAVSLIDNHAVVCISWGGEDVNVV